MTPIGAFSARFNGRVIMSRVVYPVLSSIRARCRLSSFTLAMTYGCPEVKTAPAIPWSHGIVLPIRNSAFSPITWRNTNSLVSGSESRTEPACAFTTSSAV